MTTTINHHDPDLWRNLSGRKAQRDEEYRTGKIGPATYEASLMNYGYLRKEAATERHLIDMEKR